MVKSEHITFTSRNICSYSGLLRNVTFLCVPRHLAQSGTPIQRSELHFCKPSNSDRSLCQNTVNLIKWFGVFPLSILPLFLVFYSFTVICLVVDIFDSSYLISLSFLNLWIASFISLGKFLAIVISTVVSPLFSLFCFWKSDKADFYHFLSFCSIILRSIMSNLRWSHSLEIYFNFKYHYF